MHMSMADLRRMVDFLIPKTRIGYAHSTRRCVGWLTHSTVILTNGGSRLAFRPQPATISPKADGTCQSGPLHDAPTWR